MPRRRKDEEDEESEEELQALPSDDDEEEEEYVQSSPESCALSARTFFLTVTTCGCPSSGVRCSLSVSAV